MNDVGLGKHGASRSDAGCRPRKCGGPPGELLYLQPQPLGLLLEEGPGARGAGRIRRVLLVASLAVEEDEREALSSHGDDIAAAGEKVPCPLDRGQGGVDEVFPEPGQAAGDTGGIERGKAGTPEQLPDGGLDLPGVLEGSAVHDRAVLDHDGIEAEGTDVDAETPHGSLHHI